MVDFDFVYKEVKDKYGYNVKKPFSRNTMARKQKKSKRSSTSFSSPPTSNKKIPVQRLTNEENVPGRRSWVLSFVFFLSGCSALIFETLWFRLAGLAFGNTVWASAIVLSAFMIGLAIGNGLCIRFGHSILRPIRFYAIAEGIVAVTGILIVLSLPYLTQLLTPLFSSLHNLTTVTNILRLLISFSLLLFPATAMGMTLPVLVRALRFSLPEFGQALGKLYGWNTLGAMAGALLSESVLILYLGITGAGFFAGGLNLLAIAISLVYSRKIEKPDIRKSSQDHNPETYISKIPVKILLTAFLSGFILLAFEVIWFRFMTLFIFGTSLGFSIMLAMVLFGIGVGGLVASFIFKKYSDFHHFLPIIALLSGIISFSTYIFIQPIHSTTANMFWNTLVLQTFFLVFPLSVLSGVLFTLLGSAVFTQIADDTKSAGYITIANTIGAGIGSAIAGFLLLPFFGMELSFFVLALLYFVVAIFTMTSDVYRSRLKLICFTLSIIIFITCVLSFPFGRMSEHMDEPIKRLKKMDMNVVSKKEGVNQTIQLMQRNLYGELYFHKLITNSHSMSANNIGCRRYMKLYVYLPVALKPDITSALLISYGVGSTAKALTDTKQLKKIDIVDISRDILDHSAKIFTRPGDNPLDDARTNVYLEDGRFFLQTTNNMYDLITGEPPPPKGAGVVNLYTREYFQLVYDRLNAGGILTYWLPVSQLQQNETQSILKAFSSVFPNCSLWTGTGLEWMMVGIKGDLPRVTSEEFSRQWKEPGVSDEMKRLGFERPEQMGALLLMDARTIASYVRDSLPLTDNYPKRLSDHLTFGSNALKLKYADLMQIKKTSNVFRNSQQIKDIWPPDLYLNTQPYFYSQQLINFVFWKTTEKPIPFYQLHRVLHHTTLETLVLFLMKTDQDRVQAATSASQKGLSQSPWLLYDLGGNALAQRNYTEALEKFNALSKQVNFAEVAFIKVYLLFLTGDKKNALAVWASVPSEYKNIPSAIELKNRIAKTFEIRLMD